jgi:hypothetical protein
LCLPLFDECGQPFVEVGVVSAHVNLAMSLLIKAFFIAGGYQA